MSVDVGKKKPPSGPGNFTHWKRPNSRMYIYNYEYGESYYQPQVRYLASISSESKVSTSVSSSSSSYRSSARSASRSVSSRALRASSTPPGAQSFIERWTSDPFYGRYGPAPSWSRNQVSVDDSVSLLRSMRASSESRINRVEESWALSSEAATSRSVRASSETRLSQLEQRAEASASRSRCSRNVQSSSETSSSENIRSLRQRAKLCASSLEEISSLSSNTRSNIREALARASETSALATAYDAYAKDYPHQHVVCPPNCPLHNDPNYKRRFVLGNRYLDAAALGGFDVLYDPANSTKLVKKLRSVNETESEEIYAERSSEMESSRSRLRYQEASW